jgi:CNT family concentrative nucleoside transporter
LVLHRDDLGWLIPTLLWLCITIRLVTLHVSIKPVNQAISWAWNSTVVKVVDLIPDNFRLPLGALGTVLIILVGTFTSPQSDDNTHANRAVSLFGLLVFIGVFYATSNNRKMINWHTVIVGMLAQFILALFVLRTQVGVSLTSTMPIFELHMNFRQSSFDSTVGPLLFFSILKILRICV